MLNNVSSKTTFHSWLIHTAWDWDGDWDQDQWFLIYRTEKFTLAQGMDRNQDPLSPIVLVQFTVPVLVPIPVLYEYAIAGTSHWLSGGGGGW